MKSKDTDNTAVIPFIDNVKMLLHLTRRLIFEY